MGLFNKLFSNTNEGKEVKTVPWLPLTTLDQLQTIEKVSATKTQVIFKHSTRCGISRMVLKHFETAYDVSANHIDLYYLDLLNYRDISSEVGIKFQVMHQSPQLLVIKNGVAVAFESHGAINSLDMNAFI